eukprot:g10163.t1
MVSGGRNRIRQWERGKEIGPARTQRPEPAPAAGAEAAVAAAAGQQQRRPSRRPRVRPRPSSSFRLRGSGGGGGGGGCSSGSSGSSSSSKSSLMTGGRRTTAAGRVAAVLALSAAAAGPAAAQTAAAAPPACSPASSDLTVSTAAQLAALVQAANCSQGEVSVSWEGALVFSGPIVVGNSTSVSLTGVGAGAALDGGGASRLFEVAEGGSLFLENVELRNGRAPLFSGGGGAIFADGESFTLQATSCAFTGNSSPQDGGVILSTGGLSTMEFTECLFEGNSAELHGGAIKADSATAISATNTIFLENMATGSAFDADGGAGGAIYLTGGAPQLDFHGCEVRANNATASGGAVFYEAGGGITVNATRLEANGAKYSGGAIRAGGDIAEVTVVDAVFERNFVNEIASWNTEFYPGGALYVTGQATVAVRSSTFGENGAHLGGAAFLRGNNTITIEDSVFEDNMGFVEGGALVLSGYGDTGFFEASFSDTVFSDNWCGGNGGAMSSYTSAAANVTLLRTNFTANAVNYRDDTPNDPGSYRGGAYSTEALGPGARMQTLAEDCLFRGNVAGARGGGVSVDGASFSATGCEFSDNVAGNGGAVAAETREDDHPPGAVVLSGGALRGNSATSSPYNNYYGYGGGLFVGEGDEATVTGVAVEGNAGAFGGAVSAWAEARVSASGSNFSANVAEVAGGAVQVWGNGSVFVSDGCLFVDNAAEGDAPATSSSSSSSGSSSFPTVDAVGPAGGAFSVSDGGGLVVRDSGLEGNTADGRGGGVYCGRDANVTVARARFDGQRSALGGSLEGHGGACAAVAGCSVTLDDVIFEGNQALAASGGAVSAEGGAELSTTGCTLSGNRASGGGAVFGTGEDTRVTVVSSTFKGNVATKEGGGLRAFALGHVRTESLHFDGNHAGELGGGIHCFECTMWATNSTFDSNTADGDGGGMRLSSSSTVTVNLCSFSGNRAVYDGGAIAVDTSGGAYNGVEEVAGASTQTMNGTTGGLAVELLCQNTTFDANEAGERGGSLYSNADSSIEMVDCNSTSNTATLGGSIYMSLSELVLRNCLLSGDTVPTGAIVYALGANVRSRESTFVDTTANTGMLAIQAGASTVFQAQDCQFVGWAGSDVVLADDTGEIEMDGCDFGDSTASRLVYVPDEGVPAIVRNAHLGAGNYEAANYGADLVSSVAEADNATASLFGSNIAGCSMSGCGSEDDCLEGDLGVYCSCYTSVVDKTSTCLGQSGALTLEGPTSVVSTTYPSDPSTTLTLTWNANASAGGTDSQDSAGEGAGAGGPGLWELVWVDDPSSVTWVAVPSNGLAYPGDNITIYLEGEVSREWNGLSTTSFVSETPFQAEVEPARVVVNATFVYCTQGEYWDGSECQNCADVGLNPEGVDCRSEGTLLETLPIQSGYWRSAFTSTTIRECFNDDACVGSVGSSRRIADPDDYCATGYLGPYCAVCEGGYTTGVSHTCHSCDSSFWAGMVVVMALTVVVVVLGLVIILNDLVGNPALTDLSETRFSVMSRRLRTIPFHKLKIPLVVFQIMTQYASITSIEFPPVFQTFLSTISVINLELGWLFSSVCIIDVNFHGKLVVATVGPLVILLVLLATYFYTCKKHGLRVQPREVDDQAIYPMSGMSMAYNHGLGVVGGGGGSSLSPRSSSENETSAEPAGSVIRRVQDKYATVALTMAFLFYSTVSTVIFQTFTCDELADVDERWLRADYGIDCDSSKHKAFQLYAGFMILVYPVGIPIVFAVMLWRKRSIINPPKDILPPGGVLNFPSSGQGAGGAERYGRPNEPDPRLSDGRIAQTAFLWRAYRPGAYYFEVVECFRRLLLTGCLVFILPNSAGQAAVACVLAVLTVGVFAVVNPYSDANDHRAYTLGALTIFLTMFMGLVVRVNLANEETESQRVLGLLLILLAVGLLVVAVLECLWEARRLSRRDAGDDDDDDFRIFRRRWRRDSKAKDGGGGGKGGAGRGGGGGDAMEDKLRSSGALYAPKLQDVPLNRGGGAPKNNSNNSELLEAEKAAAAGGPRPRGSQMFMLSSTADHQQDNNRAAHFAIAGTSSHLHPSGRGGTGFPMYRGVGSIGIAGGGSGGGGGGGDGLRSPSGSHSPLHPRRFGGTDHVRRDSGGGGGGGMVPAEAESAPPGAEFPPVLPGDDAIGAAGGGRAGGKKRSKKRRGGGGRSSSSRRDRSLGSDGGMRPAMPDDGPAADEMRPSPGDGSGVPGPWGP